MGLDAADRVLLTVFWAFAVKSTDRQPGDVGELDDGAYVGL